MDLPNLGSISGSTCAYFTAEALGGSKLLLGGPGNSSSGVNTFLASGAGSLIDLHSLSNFLTSFSLSSHETLTEHWQQAN